MAKADLKKKFSTGKIPTGGDFAELIEEQGTQGPAGKDGSKGEPGTNGTDGKDGGVGPKGADGKDGFGTEAEYNALVDRLEALEGAE